MFLILTSDWNGLATGQTLFEQDSGRARRMLDIGVARLPSLEEIEKHMDERKQISKAAEKLQAGYQDKQVSKAQHNKHKQNKRKLSSESR